MRHTFRTVLILLVLKCIWYSSRLLVDGHARDKDCFNNCRCCVNNNCSTNYGWTNVCSEGCIDGHRGARCYELCIYNCQSCANATDICDKCYEGFYLGSNDHCKPCPVGCKACTSKTHCTACRDGYFDEGGSSTCAYSSENCKSQGVSADYVTTATLATLLGLTTAALCFLLMKKLIQKMRSPDRNTNKSMPQTDFVNSLAGKQNSQNEVSEVQADNMYIVPCDNSTKTEQARVRNYDEVKPNTPASAGNIGNGEYVDMSLSQGK